MVEKTYDAFDNTALQLDPSRPDARKSSCCAPQAHDSDTAFLAFLQTAVLNSWDGEAVEDDSGHACLMNAANSSCEGGMCESLAANDAPMAAAYDQTLHAASAPGAAVSPKKRTREEAEATDKNNAGASPAATRGGEDTASVATMPMPNRPLNTDDSEVTSAAVAGPNDLAGSTQSPAAAKRRKTGAAAQDSDAAAAAAAAAEAESVFKAVLVAKVLTKSDASSKRIILPRISVEANLPELTAPNGGGAGGAHGQGRHLHFDALDRHGRRWELTVKAWANGSNPKPVFVLEGGIAELMKKYKLGPGDVVGLLASADGRHFVHWNTEQIREAAARPTFCAFEFAQHQQQQEQALAAETATAAVAANSAPAAAAVQPVPAAQAHKLPTPQISVIPVSMGLVIPGMFSPSSPCELMLMGAEAASAAAVAAAGAPAYLLVDPEGSGAVIEWATEPASSAFTADYTACITNAPTAAEDSTGVVAEAPAATAVEEVVAPAALAERVGGIVHQAGALLCPRTRGCTRPAGHQGWCVGHRKKGGH